MTTIYLIRHSLKEKNYEIIDSDDSSQVKNEKVILSCEGEEKARKLAKLEELQNIDEVWASNYVRSIETAKYICFQNQAKLNISSSFDERHYGTWSDGIDKDNFWISQFQNADLKNLDGESMKDVQRRVSRKIEEILENNKNKKVAIVCHNACILFYLLQYCKLEQAKIVKRLTITFHEKLLIQEGIMASPSIMKLEFDGFELKDISYIKLD